MKAFRYLIASAVVGTLACSVISFGFYQASGAGKEFPKDLVVKVGEQLDPKVEIREEVSLELANLKELNIETASADVVIETLEAATKTDQSASGAASLSETPSETAALVLVGEVSRRRVGPDGKPQKWIAAHRNGGVFEVRVFESGEPDNRKFKFDFRDRDLELRVRLPKTFAGRLKITTASGKLEVKSPALAGVEFKSGSGDVEISEAKLDFLRIQSASGDAKIDGRIGEFVASLTSGDIDASLGAMPPHKWSLSTVSGDIELKVDEASPFDVKMRTVGGDTKSDFPNFNRTESPGRTEMTGKLGAGGGELEAESVSGDIRLGKRKQ